MLPFPVAGEGLGWDSENLKIVIKKKKVAVTEKVGTWPMYINLSPNIYVNFQKHFFFEKKK